MNSRKNLSKRKGSFIGRDEINHAFGRVLRNLRLEKGISQVELATRADFDRTYPSLLERGLRSPTITVVVKLAEVLPVKSPGALLDLVIAERANNQLSAPGQWGKRS